MASNVREDAAFWRRGEFSVPYSVYAFGRPGEHPDDDGPAAGLRVDTAGLRVRAGGHASDVELSVLLLPAGVEGSVEGGAPVGDGSAAVVVEVPATGWALAVDGQLQAGPGPGLVLPAGRWAAELSSAGPDPVSGLVRHTLRLRPLDDTAAAAGSAAAGSEGAGAWKVETDAGPDRGRSKWSKHWYPKPGRFTVTVTDMPRGTTELVRVDHAGPAEWHLSVSGDEFMPTGEKWRVETEREIAAGVALAVVDDRGRTPRGLRDPVAVGRAVVRLSRRVPEAVDVSDDGVVGEDVDGVRLEVRLR